MSKNRETAWLDAWYGKRKWTFLLLPLMWLYRLLSQGRRFYLQQFSQQILPVPVVVVGNISVGGTGKTPLLITLVEYLQAKGLTPGVVSRGYGGRAPYYPFLLTAKATEIEAGDEPWSIYQQTGCAVCVGADRVTSANILIQQGCNIILSDDGLQHYRLGRHLEIAVVDGQRGFGNGFCLPVGPLREPIKRLQEVDFVIVNGATDTTLIDKLNATLPAVFTMDIQALNWVKVQTQEYFPLTHLSPSTSVHALAGIGNPERFFITLRNLNLHIITHEFPDHHRYVAQDFNFSQTLPLVMTAKDAVKCLNFARQDWYYLAIQANLSKDFWQAFDVFLAENFKPN